MCSLVLIVGCTQSSEKPKDTIKPHVMINNPTKAKVGQEILIDYVVSDNVTAVSKLIVDIYVVKDNQNVNLVDNKFIAEEGIYTIKINARDEAGNLGSMTIDITVSGSANPSGDTVKPTVFIEAPSEAYSGEEVTIGYIVEDNLTFASDIDVEVIVKKDGSEVNVADNKFIAEEGNYEIVVKATDNAGNVTIMTKNLLCKADDLEPTIEVSELSGVLVGDEVTLDYLLSDNVSSEEEIDLEIILSRGDKVREVAKTFKVIAEGEYELTLKAKDKVGNIATKKISFTVEKGREDRVLSNRAISPTNEVTLDAFIDAEDVIEKFSELEDDEDEEDFDFDIDDDSFDDDEDEEDEEAVEE